MPVGTPTIFVQGDNPAPTNNGLTRTDRLGTALTNWTAGRAYYIQYQVRQNGGQVPNPSAFTFSGGGGTILPATKDWEHRNSGQIRDFYAFILLCTTNFTGEVTLNFTVNAGSTGVVEETSWMVLELTGIDTTRGTAGVLGSVTYYRPLGGASKTRVDTYLPEPLDTANNMLVYGAFTSVQTHTWKAGWTKLGEEASPNHTQSIGYKLGGDDLNARITFGTNSAVVAIMAEIRAAESPSREAGLPEFHGETQTGSSATSMNLTLNSNPAVPGNTLLCLIAYAQRADNNDMFPTGITVSGNLGTFTRIGTRRFHTVTGTTQRHLSVHWLVTPASPDQGQTITITYGGSMSRIGAMVFSFPGIRTADLTLNGGIVRQATGAQRESGGTENIVATPTFTLSAFEVAWNHLFTVWAFHRNAAGPMEQMHPNSTTENGVPPTGHRGLYWASWGHGMVAPHWRPSEELSDAGTHLDSGAAVLAFELAAPPPPIVMPSASGRRLGMNRRRSMGRAAAMGGS